MRAKKRRRGPRGDEAVARKLIASNVSAALRDGSYTLIDRWVEELLKDPAVRKKIDYHSREILKAIAAGL